jgi:FkbM family methyltransferase
MIATLKFSVQKKKPMAFHIPFFNRLNKEGIATPGNEFFSQEGEDAVLAGLLPHGNLRGFFVDVGAHHPTRFSNTWKFYQAGWRGINIDPTPGSMQPFRALRSEDVNLEIGISRQPGKRQFYCYNEPALNGIDNDRREELADTPYQLKAIIDIETLPLAEILDRHGQNYSTPSFLTVDVEGFEMEVLSSHDWAKYPFGFILIEQRLPDLTALGSSEVWRFLVKLGYSAVACTGRTVIYRSTSQPA